MSALPVVDREISPDDALFWRGVDAGTLLIGHCDGCSTSFWYPRPFCPTCGGDARTVPASGAGTVYSFTVVRKARGAFGDCVPYVVAYVELSEGPRILTNIVDCDPADVSIGMPVEIGFDAHPAGEGRRVYRFRPRPGGR